MQIFVFELFIGFDKSNDCFFLLNGVGGWLTGEAQMSSKDTMISPIHLEKERVAHYVAFPCGLFSLLHSWAHWAAEEDEDEWYFKGNNMAEQSNLPPTLVLTESVP